MNTIDTSEVLRILQRPTLSSVISSHDPVENGNVAITYELTELSEDRLWERHRFDLVIVWTPEDEHGRYGYVRGWRQAAQADAPAK